MFMFNRRLRLVCIGVAIAVSIATRAFAADEKAKPATLSADQSSKSGIDVQSVVLRLLEEAEVPAQEAGVITSVAVREGQRETRRAARADRRSGG